MANKPQVTRSFHPLHFEDLDPHRFEDLVRQLIYDLKDWQSIEATGRSGSDQGVDIRAWEKATIITNRDEEAEEEGERSTDGNLWIVQCKREKELGPNAVKKILHDGLQDAPPPYGYMLVAPVNFSKKSYDTFRDELLRVGVKEFYLWGRAELEDMLAMPKNDHILFSFFGISYIVKKRTKASEIRFRINNKNKLFRLLGEPTSGGDINRSVLLRDVNDSNYPSAEAYRDFALRPRWEEYSAIGYQPQGLIVHYREHFAYYHEQTKEYDFTKAVNLVRREPRPNAWDNNNKEFELRNEVDTYWRHLPLQHQAIFKVYGLIPFEDIYLIDEKGDTENPFPHLYVDFRYNFSPLAKTRLLLHWHNQHIEVRAGLIRKTVFPKTFPPFVPGTIHTDKEISLPPEELSFFNRDPSYFRTMFDIDERYSYLKPRDVIFVAKSAHINEKMYLEVTHEYRTTVKEYLANMPSALPKHSIERQAGRTVADHDTIHVFEVRTVYGWQLKCWQTD